MLNQLDHIMLCYGGAAKFGRLCGATTGDEMDDFCRLAEECKKAENWEE